MRNLSKGFYLLYLLLPFLTASLNNCDSQSEIVGCITCSSGYNNLYDRSLQKYVCIADDNCLLAENQVCVSCASPTVFDSDTGNCITGQEGCIQYTNGTCTQCAEQFYYSTGDGSCIIKSINYCQEYSATAQCQTCLYSYMDPATNCSVTASLCTLFDRTTWKCQICPDGTIIHPSGIICLTAIANCLEYSPDDGSCLYCEDGYFLSATSQCNTKYDAGIKASGSLSGVSWYICLDRSKIFNQTSEKCDSAPDNIDYHCFEVNQTCDSCMDGYYLAEENSVIICKECQSIIDNCLMCSNSSYCQACEDGYYPLTLEGTTTHCMSCESYGCDECYIEQSTQATPRVLCRSCPRGFTLYSGACFECSNLAETYSVQDALCISCNITNCQYCRQTRTNSGDETVCTWCDDGYYLNPTTSLCVAIANTTAVSLETAQEILSRSATDLDTEFYNDQVSLMAACDQTDGYICHCDSITTVTSLCNSFTYASVLTALATTDTAQFAQYPEVYRMAAELSTFALTSLDLTSSEVLLSQKNYWNLLSAYTSLIIRQQNGASVPTDNTKLILSKINDQTSTMISVFSQQKITIIRGNGFYYKFIPAGLSSGGSGDDTYIKTSMGSANWFLYYIYYDRVASSSQLTGHIFAFTNSTSSFDITVRKNGFISNSENFTLRVSGVSRSSPQVTFSDGYLKISGASRTQTNYNGYQIFSTSESDVHIYTTERIQYIFYSESFLYILFFILLYLIFLPLCALVDCCETEHHHRKRVNTEQYSENMKRSSESEEVTVVRVNYRQFFPIYNVGSTPRPKRLMKLCLLIVNLQHGITFLTLCYFNLQADNEVSAVALAVPAYLATIVMGYICGALFRFLPGRSKYLINIVAVGYWILWVILMRNFVSSEYKLFLLVFAIIFFVIDLLLDGLEMLLVYFSIKQGEKQVSLFNCLSRWLSLRGYYQFDKLAKELAADDD